jgi:MoxR-like ATPase
MTMAQQMTLVVYGPQGCGKTQNAVALAKHFGLNMIYDKHYFGDPLPLMNVLALSNDTPPAELNGVRCMSFDEAMAQMRAAATA